MPMFRLVVWHVVHPTRISPFVYQTRENHIPRRHVIPIRTVTVRDEPFKRIESNSASYISVMVALIPASRLAPCFPKAWTDGCTPRSRRCQLDPVPSEPFGRRNWLRPRRTSAAHRKASPKCLVCQSGQRMRFVIRRTSGVNARVNPLAEHTCNYAHAFDRSHKLDVGHCTGI